MDHSKDISFYILNKQDELVTTLSTEEIGDHLPILSAVVDSKLESYNILTLVIPADAEGSELIKEDYSIIFEDITGWREYLITSYEDIDGDKVERTITAELSSIELLDDVLESDLTTTSPDPEVVLAEVLAGTRWTVGTVDASLYNRTFNSSVKYLNVLEVIDLLSSHYAAEVSFSYTIDTNRIVKRSVNLYKQIGTNRGKWFEVDKDVTEIKRTVDISDIKTAIIPYGSEDSETGVRLDIADVEWSVAAGDPVDKPKGQTYLADAAALEQWGRKGSNGSKRHRFITMEINEETPEAIASMAWVQLGRYTQPKMTYEAAVVDLFALTGDKDLQHEQVFLGDTAVITDNYFADPIAVQTRIVELKRDLLDPTLNEVVLGDSKQLFKAKDSVDAVEAKVDSMAAKVAVAVSESKMAQQMVNGKNSIYYGTTAPAAPNVDDLWFMPHPTVPDELIIKRFNGTIWDEAIDSSKAAVAEEAARLAKNDAEAAKQSAQTAYDKAVTAENALQSKVSDEEFQSSYTQLADDILLRVKSDELVNQINVSTEGILIDGAKVHITGETFIDNAVITDAMIKAVSADKLTVGTLDGSKVNVIDLNASNITGGTLDIKKVAVTNGINKVLSVNGTTGEVEMNVTKLTINAAPAATQSYADSKATAAETAAKSHADTKANAAETAAKTHADSKAGAAETAAKAHANTVAAAEAEVAEKQAKAYADGLVTAEEQRAIDDAVAKLNAAKAHADSKASAAETAAKTHADSKASAAETAAKTHADTKAKAAETAAKTYAEQKVDGLEIGGRNYFTPSLNPPVKTGGGSFDMNENVPYGFYTVGDQGGTTLVRINNVITGNGLWTVSFDLKGSQNGGGTVTVDIADQGAKTIRSSVDNEYKRYSVTVEVTNFGDGSTYHFVDFKPSWAYIWVKNIQVEKGSKASDFMVPLEETEILIGTKADQEFADQLATDISNFETVAATKEELGEILTALNDYREVLENAEAGVTTAKTDIADLLSRVPLIENNLKGFTEDWNFLDTYIRMADEGLLIGSKTGNTAIRISDERIDFMDGSGEPVAFITNQVMQINRGIFVESATIGQHKIETIGDGVTIFTWIN